MSCSNVWGFRNLISRFSEEEKEETARREIERITDLAEAQEIFDRAKKAERVGFAILTEDHTFVGVALCEEETKVSVFLPEGFLTESYLQDQMSQVCQQAALCAAVDVKPMLDFLEPVCQGRLYDCAVAAYLLNPLKSAYPCDELVREYTGELSLPERSCLASTLLPKPGKRKKRSWWFMPAIWRQGPGSCSLFWRRS